MKFLTTIIMTAMAGLVSSAPLETLEGCNQGTCPAINAGFDFIDEGGPRGYNALRINAHKTCKLVEFTDQDGCTTFNFGNGNEEVICVDRDRERAKRTGTKGFRFQQCWHLARSFYCKNKALWTPDYEVRCNF